MAFQTTTILSLLFDVTTNIVQYLPLKDALHFSTISTTAFDAVYYTFAHRTILNFASCLDERGCIQLTKTSSQLCMLIPGPLRSVILYFHQHSKVLMTSNFTLKHTYVHVAREMVNLIPSTPHEWVTNPLTREVYYGFMNTLDSFDPTGRVCNNDTTSPDIHNMHWSNGNLDDLDEHILIDREYQDFFDNLDYISDEYLDSKRHHPRSTLPLPTIHTPTNLQLTSTTTIYTHSNMQLHITIYTP